MKDSVGLFERYLFICIFGHVSAHLSDAPPHANIPVRMSRGFNIAIAAAAATVLAATAGEHRDAPAR